MKEIRFKEISKVNSQQTLVSILKDREFYFKPLSNYENTMFHLIVRHKYLPAESRMFKKAFGWLGAKAKEKYIDCPIAYSVETGYPGNTIINVPIVFTRDDIVAIVNDVPETYIGEDVL